MASKAGTLQIQLQMEVAQLRRDLQTTNAELKKQTGAWQSSVNQFGQALRNAFAGAAVLAAVRQFAGVVNQVIDDMGRIADQSQVLGDTAENFQRLEQAAAMAGVEMDKVSTASNKLQANLGKIAKGEGKDAAEALDMLGLSAKDLEGLGTVDAFVKVAGALGQVESKSKQAAAGTAIFSRGWASLLPLIGQGEQAMRDAMEAAVVASNEAVAAGDDFGDSLQAMQTAFRNLIADGLVPILPAFTALMNVLRDTAKESKDAQGDMSSWESVAKTVAKAGALMAASFMATKAMMTTLGQAIGIFVGATVRQWELLREAIDIPLFDSDAWSNWNARQKAVAQEARDSFAALKDAGKQSATEIESFYTKAFAAIDAAKVTVPEVKAPGGGAGDPAEVDKNTEAVKRNTEAKKAAAAAARAWAQAEEAAQRLRDEAIAKEAVLVDLGRDIDAERMRGGTVTDEEMRAREESIRLWRLDIENADAYTRAVSDANAALEALRTSNDEARQKTRDRIDQQKQEADAWASWIQGGISDIFMAMTEGADSATDAIKRLLIQLLATLAAQKALAAFNQFFGFGVPAAKGMAFAMGGARLFAQGGIVTGATPFTFGGGQLGVMGEAGPEAIMPLKRGPDGRLGVAGGGNISIHNYGGSKVTVERDRDDVRILIDQVRAQLASDVSRGGTALSGALERTYGMRR